MNFQIRSTSKRRRLTIPAVPAVAVLAAFGLWSAALSTSHQAASTRDPGPSAAALIRRDLSSQLTLSATLGYRDSYTVTLAAAPTASVFTALPSVGQVISQGQALYALNGISSVLLYGTTPAWRTLSQGASGADVAQLNVDLVSLGAATSGQLDPTSDVFSAATATAVEKLQAALGAPPTGTLALGQAVFLPTAARIITVSATVGSTARAGAQILTATSPTRQITATLDATQRSRVSAGDPVTITLPDGTTTTGVVDSVGTVATAQSSSSPGTSAPPTVQVDITPSDPVATGTVDQAPVTVAVTTATVTNALAVPVEALTTSNGQPALDLLDPAGPTRPVTVTLGLFDDADGLVQVKAAGLAIGDRVALPDQHPTTSDGRKP